MRSDSLIIRGAKEHNLKGFDLTLPRNRFIVITGLSGSGKSSLAFDTIYAEGQRRYVESLSAYARQFLDQMQKPLVDHIEGLSPTISIEQKTVSRNPRSTVATQTEIYDYLRLLFARVGTPHCPSCGKRIESQSSQQIVDAILLYPQGTKINILAPLVRGRKGEYRTIGAEVARSGFARLRADGKIYDTQEKIALDKYKIHHIEAVVDRLTVRLDVRKRLFDSVETALKTGQGMVIIDFNGGRPDVVFSERYACTECGTSLSEIEPRIFSFNSPYGACEVCNGLGTKMEIDPEALVPDPDKPWTAAIAPWKKGRRGYMMYYRAVLREIANIHDVDPRLPFGGLDKKFKHLVFYGSDDTVWGRRFEGVVKYLERLFKQTDSDWLKDEISGFMSVLPCPACQAKRLKPASLAVKIADKSIADVTALSIKEAKAFFHQLSLPKDKTVISAEVLKEIRRRLDFCINVGLEYLTLERRSATLSGGEAQRIHLATQVGSGLVGVIYVLDEPSIGLHQKDNDRLLSTLHALRDLGNTLIVVEHDEDTIRRADYVVDLGPGAGEQGGRIIYAGDVQGIIRCRESLTGQYLSGAFKVRTPQHRRDIT
ncbi:MAG TPA: excinuclease ABC subunit UvrA, partial [Candidatus Omnitrophota bacterium]|nr:excinuclease ABC subunit UvrA [Candidatus Omnitrophota bacterium]